MKLELLSDWSTSFQPIRSINQSSSVSNEGRELKENKVKFMATQLLAKFEDSTASCSIRRQVNTILSELMAWVEDLHYMFLKK